MEALLPEVIYLRNTSYESEMNFSLFARSQGYTHGSQLECDMNDIHPEAEVPLLCVAPAAKEEIIRIKGTASGVEYPQT